MSEDKWSDYVPTMLASTFAGVIARVPCHPMDTCKARLQTQTWLSTHARSHGLYKNLFDALRSIWRTEGYRGLYRGFGITALGSAPASCLYFTTYEVTKHTLSQDSSGKTKASEFYVHFTAGMVAETVSCLLWVPIDVIKERMQIQRVPTAGATSSGSNVFYATGYEAIKKTVRNEGISGFYRGYGATVMSFGPFSAFYFMFYEQFKLLTKGIGGYESDSDLNLAHFLLCGASAGATASFLTNPLDLVKLRLQVQRGEKSIAFAEGANISSIGKNSNVTNISQVNYRHLLDGLIKLYQYEGLAGMTRGAGARMAFQASSTAIIISTFEQLKILLNQ